MNETTGQPGEGAHSRTQGHGVILGAGVAGLATALKLGEAGWSTELLEREPQPGGLARCLQFKGVSTDLGPHRIHTEIPEVAELIERVAASSLYTVKRKSHIYLRGHFLPYPPSPVAMARRLGPHRLAGFGMSYLWHKTRGDGGEETYESLMQGAFGPALYDFLIRPYTAKTWKVDPAELHADTARVRVSAGSLAKMVTRLLRREKRGQETALKEFRYVRGGAQTLVNHLREQAEAVGAHVRLQTEARRIELDADLRVQRVVTGDAGGHAEAGEGSAAGDFYFNTLPLPVLLGRLLPDREELRAAREAAAGLDYIDMIFVCLIVRRKVITGDNWLYFPEPHLVFNRAYEAKSMDPGMGPEDRSVMCLEITCRRGDELSRTSDEELLAQAIAQVTETGLFRADEVEESLVYRLPWAYPLYSRDYDVRLRQVFEGLSRIENLITLGRQGLFNHNNMDHSMFMGIRAAECLRQHGTGDATAAWYAGAEQFKHMRIVD